MWYLIFYFLGLLFVLIISIPFLITITVTCNVVKLKGMTKIKILFWTTEIRFRIKHGYLYLYRNGKEIKEKLSSKNVNLRFLLHLMNEIYYRERLISLEFVSNFGYNIDALTTALVSGYIDVISRAVLSKIKHNKKSANIFTQVEPKYNQDICNIRVKTKVDNSLFDLLIAFVMAKCYMRSKNV